MNISENGLSLVKHFEGLFLRGYRCPANVWTIGYGHTGSVNGATINDETTITQEQANALLAEDMRGSEQAVTARVKVPLEQHQFDALVSFVFNCGAHAFSLSNLLKLLNTGKISEVPAQFGRWIHGGGRILPGLVRRRKTEEHLFSTGELKFFQ